MNYPKKNQTVKMYADAEKTTPIRFNFDRWGEQYKHVYKANWIDFSHARNIVSAQLLWLEQQSDKDITIHIASPGGSIYSGYQILDTMQFIKPEISTVSMGMVASMASVIASSGTKGKRFILPHSRFLVHQPLGGTKGQCSDIQIEAKEIQILKDELQHILAENSGQDYETIEKMCDRDTILTAQEAVDYGFVDSIVMNKKHKVLV